MHRDGHTIFVPLRFAFKLLTKFNYMRKSVFTILLLALGTCSYARDAPQKFFQVTEVDMGKVPFLQEEIVIEFQ